MKGYLQRCGWGLGGVTLWEEHPWGSTPRGYRGGGGSWC